MGIESKSATEFTLTIANGDHNLDLDCEVTDQGLEVESELIPWSVLEPTRPSDASIAAGVHSAVLAYLHERTSEAETPLLAFSRGAERATFEWFKEHPPGSPAYPRHLPHLAEGVRQKVAEGLSGAGAPLPDFWEQITDILAVAIGDRNKAREMTRRIAAILTIPMKERSTVAQSIRDFLTRLPVSSEYQESPVAGIWAALPSNSTFGYKIDDRRETPDNIGTIPGLNLEGAARLLESFADQAAQATGD